MANMDIGVYQDTNNSTSTTALSLKDDRTDTSTGTIVTSNSDRKYLATYFVAGSSYTMKEVHLWLDKVGSPTYDIHVEIFPHSTNEPGTAAVSDGTSGTISASTLTTSEAEYTFTGLNCSITSGTTYWVVLVVGGSSFTHYARWHKYAGSYPGYTQTQKTADPTVSWGTQENSTGKFQTYG